MMVTASYENGEDKSLEKFIAFSVEEWQGWLSAFLNYEPCQPDVPIGPGHPH